jgi:hypothetical protein
MKSNNFNSRSKTPTHHQQTQQPSLQHLVFRHFFLRYFSNDVIKSRINITPKDTIQKKWRHPPLAHDKPARPECLSSRTISHGHFAISDRMSLEVMLEFCHEGIKDHRQTDFFYTQAYRNGNKSDCEVL